MKLRRLWLILAGGAAVFLGAALFLIQLWAEGGGLAGYLLLQSLLALGLPGYCFWAGRRARTGGEKWDGLWLLLIPLALFSARHILLKEVYVPIPISALLLGLELPFHTVTSRVRFGWGLPELAALLPLLVCLAGFQMGKGRLRRRGVTALFAAALCLLTLAGASGRQPPPAGEGEAPVCVMGIYTEPGNWESLPGAGLDFGHSFLTFQNVSDGEILVGRLPVQPGEQITVGKFGNVESASGGYQGAYYNVEAQRRAVFGWYSSARSRFMPLTAEQLERVSQVLRRNERGYTGVLNNCSELAAGVWNSVLSPGDEAYFVRTATPALLYREMERQGDFETGNGGMSFSAPPCYYDGSGLAACADRLIPDSAAALTTGEAP